MTREELTHFGFTISLSRRRWIVTFRSREVVANGKIGGHYDARNKARRQALEAATIAYVKKRVAGDLPAASKRPVINIDMTYGAVRLTPGMLAKLETIKEDMRRVIKSIDASADLYDPID